jgi:hypothetical protein
VEEPEGMRPVGRPRFGWMDNIKMHLGEIEWGSIKCIDLAQDRGQ